MKAICDDQITLWGLMVSRQMGMGSGTRCLLLTFLHPLRCLGSNALARVELMGSWPPSKMLQGTMFLWRTTLGVAQMQLMMGGRKWTLLKEEIGMQHLTTTTEATSPITDHGAQCQLIDKSSGLIVPQIELFTAEKFWFHCQVIIIFHPLKDSGSSTNNYARVTCAHLPEHSDNESTIRPHSNIVTVTIGHALPIVFRNKFTQKE